MPLAAGSRIGPYEVLSPLGAGGMGEVFLARDPRLGREVAIKALPEAFAHDPERLARFEREARVLASLKHPNIAAIYGLEEADGRRYLVLEYVPGPTLADRIRQGPVPIDDALDVACQVAAGVEAAHESGVIHRDLKPANVKLTPAGEVKVLDFGLARGGESTASGSDLTHSPTVTTPATLPGVILGTAAYMAPEQARGKTVDKRADLWAFGCLLYELLTGHRAFAGDELTDTIAAILKSEPDWSALPSDTPPRVRALVARCLRKDPRERLRDIGDARIELAEIRAGGAPAAEPAIAVPPARRGRTLVAWALVTAVLVATAAFAAWRLAPRAPAAHTRFIVDPPPNTRLVSVTANAAISPDGATVAMIASDTAGTSRIWVRRLDTLAPRAVTGTEDAVELFWSPDSRALGFFADGKLHTVPVEGGSRQTIASAPDARGGSWGSRGRIVFAPVASGPLMSVPAEGGEAVVVARPDTARGENALRFPCFLPDGEHFTCVSLPRRERGECDVVLGSLSDPRTRVLFRSSTAPVHAGPGHLLFTLRGQLMAWRCDRHGRLTAKPFKVAEAPAARLLEGSPSVSASTNGVLLYRPPFANRQFAWLDRSGAVVETSPVPPGRYGVFNLSPDGRRAVVHRGEPTNPDLVMVDLERGLVSPFVSADDFAGLNGPSWSNDGTRVAFGTYQNGPEDLYVKDANGADEPELVLRSAVLLKNVGSWTPDNRAIAFEQPDPKTAWDVWLLPLSGERRPVPLVRTRANEGGGWISPDGRWLAFTSDQSGREEIYVTPFPGGGPRYQVSTSGSGGCLWRHDGREILIMGASSVSSVTIDPGPPFRVGTEQLLFRRPPNLFGFQATPDLQRFLTLVPASDAAPTGLTVEIGWLR